MTDDQTTLQRFYTSWALYQDLLLTALAPLTAEQLALQAAPNLRTIGSIATHMIGARARWFHRLMGGGGPGFAMSTWTSLGEKARRWNTAPTAPPPP